MAAHGESGLGFTEFCWRRVKKPLPVFVFSALCCLSAIAQCRAQQPASEPPPNPPSPGDLQTTEDWNRRLNELLGSNSSSDREAVLSVPSEEYRIGPEDLLEITVFEAPELNRTVRVSAGGEISLPLLGAVRAGGLSARELESVLQELLRRTYMQDPHVGVFVSEMESHPVAVFGAVEKPGVFQVRGTRTLLELLSMAQGLAEDAGDTVLVMRGASRQAPALQGPDQPGLGGRKLVGAGAQSETPTGELASADPSLAGPVGPETIEISLKSLLESGDPRYNVPIYPGDVIKVTRAGIVYVVGEVKKAGGFVLKSNENISVLQAIALAEGITRTSAQSKTRIIRTDEKSGERMEIPLDLKRIMSGKEPDPLLKPNDIVFVPNSAARTTFYRTAEAAISIITGVVIWRR